MYWNTTTTTENDKLPHLSVLNETNATPTQMRSTTMKHCTIAATTRAHYDCESRRLCVHVSICMNGIAMYCYSRLTHIYRWRNGWLLLTVSVCGAGVLVAVVHKRMLGAKQEWKKNNAHTSRLRTASNISLSTKVDVFTYTHPILRSRDTQLCIFHII